MNKQTEWFPIEHLAVVKNSLTLYAWSNLFFSAWMLLISLVLRFWCMKCHQATRFSVMRWYSECTRKKKCVCKLCYTMLLLDHVSWCLPSWISGNIRLASARRLWSLFHDGAGWRRSQWPTTLVITSRAAQWWFSFCRLSCWVCARWRIYYQL